jgi:Kef-type K+ transport system membrane component KefB
MLTAVSLFWIALAAAAAPLLAALVPRRLVAEVVLLLAFGMVIGPNVLALATVTEGIDLLSEIGLATLFLLAGYEIRLTELTGVGGRRALVTWLICFALAVGLVLALTQLGVLEDAQAAVAIALTSTALGTLLPILKSRGLLGTPVGAAVLNHGAVGELCPVVAMALLLGTRGALDSILVLAIFGVAAVVVALLAVRVPIDSGFRRLVVSGAETTGQTPIRLVILLLVSFSALAAAFELDLVLGAFASGFILRRILPAGNASLDVKLEGLAFGLLIPVFFVVSGMAIDPSEVAAEPVILAAFVILILLVRGVPIFLASRTDRSPDQVGRRFSDRESLVIGLYGATGLPVIVAVTAVTVDSGHMSEQHASLLVAGGAITVLLLPMIASVLTPRADLRPQPSDSEDLPI